MKAEDIKKYMSNYVLGEDAEGNPVTLSIEPDLINHVYIKCKELEDKLTQCETANVDFQSENKELEEEKKEKLLIDFANWRDKNESILDTTHFDNEGVVKEYINDDEPQNQE